MTRSTSSLSVRGIAFAALSPRQSSAAPRLRACERSRSAPPIWAPFPPLEAALEAARPPRSGPLRPLARALTQVDLCPRRPGDRIRAGACARGSGRCAGEARVDVHSDRARCDPRRNPGRATCRSACVCATRSRAPRLATAIRIDRQRRTRRSPRPSTEGSARARGPCRVARRSSGPTALRRPPLGFDPMAATRTALVTGGAGFIGSHLTRAAPRRRLGGLRARRPVDRLAARTSPTFATGATTTSSSTRC